MKKLNCLFIACAAILVSLPLAASARVTCESLQVIIAGLDDDQCAGISASAERCFKALNSELDLVVKNQNKARRSRAARRLTADYVRETKNWRKNYDYISSLGEGRACLDGAAKVEVWVEEMEADLKYLEQSRF